MLSNLNLPIHLISLILFGVIVLLFIFYSGMAIYSLLHFGRSRIVGTAVSVIYIVSTIALFVHALISLNSL
jgi:hypothetical protein